MEPEFVDGIIIKGPRPGAPEFVKGSISIKREELIAWLTSKSEEWINLDIKISKGGKWYTQVNTWKPEQDGKGARATESYGKGKGAQQPASDMPDPLKGLESAYADDDINPEDIPF